MDAAVDMFFKRGKLLTPEALQYLENKNADSYISDDYGLVVDIDDLLAKTDRIHIVLNITQMKKEITTSDLVKFYNSKYEKMKQVILSRIQRDFVSINKVDAHREEIFVIGIVRDVRDNTGKKSLELEDSTGSITAVFDPQAIEGIELDDVVAVQGVSGGKILFGKKIIWPDVPLRQPTKGKSKICFVSDLRLNEAPKQDFIEFLKWFEKQDIKYLILSGTVGDNKLFNELIDTHCANKQIFVSSVTREKVSLPEEFESKYIVSLSNPSMIEINGINILLARKFETRYLKKRHLGSVKPFLTEDVMILDKIPDIVLSCHGSPSVTNYKATTIVDGGSLMSTFTPIVVDLATRESRQITINEIRN